MDKKRYKKLDEIRGLALLNMIAFHAAWDLVYIYGVNWRWYRSYGAHVWQQGICWTFILLSGFCAGIGHAPGGRMLKRGAFVFLCGAAITAATLVAMPQNRVVFGVLTLIGSCMLIAGFLGKFLAKIPPPAGMAAGAFLFAVTRNVNDGWLGFEKWDLCRVPAALYRNFFTAYLGFPQKGFFSTDYFSLVPWVFLFMAGYFAARYFGEKNLMRHFEKGVSRPLGRLGRHSLLVYMAHQPAIYLVLKICMI